MRRLAPPLSEIESRLFDPSPALIRRWLDNDPSLSPQRRAALAADARARELAESLAEAEREHNSAVPGNSRPLDEPLPELPPHLAALIDARLAAAALDLPKAPAPGLILRLDQAIGPNGALDWDLGQALYVLLSEPAEHPDVWYGWLMASELDYASPWDMLLDEDDGPCDPDVGMVQVWNPVHLYCPSAAAAVGRLSAARLAAARDLAVDLMEDRPDPAEANPGVWVLRTTGSGYAVHTGTPLGGTDDPRWRYQALYAAAGDFVRDLTRHALSELAPPVPWWHRLLDALAGAAGERGLPFEPVAALEMGAESEPEPMPDSWRLGDLLVLELIPSSAGDAVELRVQLLAPGPLDVSLERDGEPRQLHRLSSAQQEVDLFAASGQGLALKVRDALGQELFAVRLPDTGPPGNARGTTGDEGDDSAG